MSPCSFLFLLLTYFIIFSFGPTIIDASANVGVIIDVDSSIGREQKTAIKVAVQNFKSGSRNHNLEVHFKNINGSHPMQAVSAAEELVREQEVEAIVGIQTWEQAALVADIVGNGAQVPVVSFSAAAVTPPLVHSRWPFLIQMANNGSEQINCISGLVQSYHWRKVIAIYEDDSFGGGSGMIALLSDALNRVGAEVEYHLALPLYSSLAYPEIFFHEEVAKILGKQSRVFIVLGSSLPTATRLFAKAKQLGLMGGDSAWILGDSLSDVLDSVDNSFISSVQGALGIKTYYSEDTIEFSDFKGQYQKIYRAEYQYPNESHFEPGFHAVQAYDSMNAVLEGVKSLGMNSHSKTSGLLLLNQILSNNFSGLGGNVQFHNGMLLRKQTFKIVNVVGRSYKEIGYWSSKFGFSKYDADNVKEPDMDAVNSMMKLPGVVNWPGDLNRVPKGWAMPSEANKLRIGVPGSASFDKYVKVEWDEINGKEKYDGFCIDLFEEALKIVEEHYPIPYEFITHNGTYDSLIDKVINNTYDAVVGDVTILVSRMKDVEFTQPFAESGLSMIVKVKDAPRAWIFLKPFTWNMWIATFAILFYTMFVVWFIEHQSNPEFRGPFRDQLGTAFWFTFSSLFGSHRDNINSNYSKVVVVIWLFVVFVLTSSYTASLTSMLTIPRLEPSVTDIQWVRKTNRTVGCDGDSFVKNYLRNVLDIHNIKTINDQNDYPAAFMNGSIVAAFLELPYKKIFLDQYCSDYAEGGESYRLGGLGFVFQRGSPIARDFSEAILALSENGGLKRLENEVFGSFDNCSDKDKDENNTASLSFKSFWALYLVYG
ncbi:hypothetical protein Leryth_018379 [Lithospermum erythrorhizon]|nr:hypothetical protein Leryth_018379 [Lithospermum erythrorhizon]